MAGRTAIGLDIGTSGVRAAELLFGKKGVSLQKFGQVALPEGAVRDGEVLDPAAVGAAIKALWSGTKFSSKKVVIGVANAKVLVRQIDLPWMTPAELSSSLGFQVQDMLPMPVESTVLDFHTVSEVEGDQGQRMLRGLLVAASRDMVNGALSAVRYAGLTPIMVDLSSFAVLRSMGAVDELGLDQSVEALVDIGAGVTNIVIHEGGVPRFVRILLMGGQDLTDAVADRMGISAPEAESVKQQLGLGGVATDEGDLAAARVVEAVGAQFVDEVRGSLDYYMASSASVPISRLVLTGGGARLRGLPERLQAATGVPVEVGRPIDRLVVGKTGLSTDQIDFLAPLAAVPVGLALGAA